MKKITYTVYVSNICTDEAMPFKTGFRTWGKARQYADKMNKAAGVSLMDFYPERDD